MIHSRDLQNSGHPPSSEISSSHAVGWKRLKFGDVCKVQGGYAFKSQEYQKSGVPLVRISNLVNGKVSFDSDTVYLPATKLDVHKDFLLKRGDTLIAMSGATTGKMATFDMDSPALLNQRVGRFRILSAEACNPRFISLLVQQITRQVLKEAYGAAQPNISPTQIEQIPIPFPPLEEQNAIVAEIEKQFTRLEAAVAGLRRVQTNFKRYRAAVLKAACEGKLVPTEAELARKEGRTYETGARLLERIFTERRQKWNGKGKYKEPITPTIKNLEPLPEGYTWATFGQVCRVQGGFAFKSREYVSRGVPLVRISNLVNGRVQLTEDTVFLPAKFVTDYPEFMLRQGDVLIAMSGATTGKMATMIEDSPALLNQRVGRFVLPTPDLSNAKFISFLVMQITQKVLKDAYGAAQPNISPSEIGAIAIPIPPLAEQGRIVAEVDRRLSLVDETEAVVNTNLQRAAHLRQSILQGAFTGKL